MSEELTRPSPHFKRYTAFGSAIDLLGADSLNGKPCQAMRFETAGTVTVKRASDDASHTLNVGDKEVLRIACNEISSVATVTGVTVFW